MVIHLAGKGSAFWGSFERIRVAMMFLHRKLIPLKTSRKINLNQITKDEVGGGNCNTWMCIKNTRPLQFLTCTTQPIQSLGARQEINAMGRSAVVCIPTQVTIFVAYSDWCSFLQLVSLLVRVGENLVLYQSLFPYQYVFPLTLNCTQPYPQPVIFWGA